MGIVLYFSKNSKGCFMPRSDELSKEKDTTLHLFIQEIIFAQGKLKIKDRSNKFSYSGDSIKIVERIDRHRDMLYGMLA